MGPCGQQWGPDKEIFRRNPEYWVDDGRVVSRVVRGNGLPVDTPTGGFPIARRDPALAFDPNPNPIAPRDIVLTHPQGRGEYHYHGPSPCLPDQTVAATLVGYALDGFGLFSTYDANGREITNADLAACHGRVGEIDWDGRRVTMYHYVLTREYPYTIGCFTGTPAPPGDQLHRP